MSGSNGPYATAYFGVPTPLATPRWLTSVEFTVTTQDRETKLLSDDAASPTNP
jgi:hypothetical protein